MSYAVFRDVKKIFQSGEVTINAVIITHAYTHVTTKMQQEAAEKMGSFMDSTV